MTIRSTPRTPFSARAALSVALVIGALVGVLGGLAHAGRSPAQAAADAAPPRPTVLTAVVERRQLEETLTTRGIVTSHELTQFHPAPPPSGEILVITRVPKQPGQALHAGELALEISGRPVLTLASALPLYRDLVPGAVGPDVVALQEALRQLRLAPGRSGVFDAATQGAVSTLFRRAGYAAPQLGGPGADPGGPPSVVVRRGDLFMVPSLPATVTAVAGGVGTTISDEGGATLVVSPTAPDVYAYASEAEAGLVKVGQRVTFDDDDATIVGSGAVASVTRTSGDVAAQGTALGTGPTPDQPFEIRIRPDRALEGSATGRAVRVAITTSSTAGPVLAVPVTAVDDGQGGTTLTRASDGRAIAVHIGRVVGGWAEITSGRVTEGARVRVG